MVKKRRQYKYKYINIYLLESDLYSGFLLLIFRSSGKQNSDLFSILYFFILYMRTRTSELLQQALDVVSRGKKSSTDRTAAMLEGFTAPADLHFNVEAATPQRDAFLL